MKVAIVASVLSHFEIPLFRLAASLPGMDVRVFHTDPSGDAFYDKDYGQVIDWGENLHAGYPSEYFPTIGELETKLFAWQPDVVMQYGYFWRGAFAFVAKARLRGIPIVHRGLLTPYANTRQQALVARVWRKVQPYFLRSFRAHHYGGSYSELVLERAGVPKSRRYFVPFSIDTTYFAKRADEPDEAQKAAFLRSSLGWAESDPVLLFMCQHSWFKAPDVMIRVVAEAQRRRPSVKLIMAGSGDMTGDLQQRAAETLRPGSYHFPGFVKSKETMPVYLASDLVLFPSRYDTWSRGVNEAMVARRPCIISRVVPAAGGLVDDCSNGYVIDGLEPGPFADAIETYLDQSPEARLAMGDRARARALEFSYEAHVDDLRRSFTETAYDEPS